MKVVQRLFIVFAAFVFLFPFSTANAASFSDVDQYENEIDFLVNEGIITGYANGTFKPKNNINRLNGVQILLRAKGITNFDAPNPGLTDMQPGTHGYAEVSKAVELGIVSGKTASDGSSYFDARGNLTRGQMAKILVEVMDFPIDTSHTFGDVPPSNGYADYISTLAAQGVTKGYLDGTFRPNEPISRQHFAVFVARMLNDDFKPGAPFVSYKLNKDYVYTRIVDDGKGTSYSEDLRYVGPEYDGDREWDMWMSIGNGERDLGLVYEDEGVLLSGIPEGDAYTDLAYPLYKGKTFIEYADAYSKVVDMNVTLTTKAGTFKDVVVVDTPHGGTIYYAANIGPIKTVQNGKTTMELVEFKKR